MAAEKKKDNFLYKSKPYSSRQKGNKETLNNKEPRNDKAAQDGIYFANEYLFARMITAEEK